MVKKIDDYKLSPGEAWELILELGHKAKTLHGKLQNIEALVEVYKLRANTSNNQTNVPNIYPSLANVDEFYEFWKKSSL